ncbi:MAG: efflux RND transporter periplasmic adaptor subunit [Flammeovirgaceae bacterium]|nr:efflux RND transporter periplasmic adaptor subunit [Flammeovirgaceae bacterium]
MNKLLKNKFIFSGFALAVGLFLGWLIFSGNDEIHQDHDYSSAIADGTIWTCAMHPQIRKNEPGACPICAMDLIPIDNKDGEMDPMAVNMSPTAMLLADVKTAIIQKGNAIKQIRLNGKVQADERNVSTQTSHIAGRIEKLPVNYTGEYVRKGQVIAFIYSPELVLAQKELFEAHKIMDVQPALYTAARAKLKNWKLTNEQIDKIIESGNPIDNFPILSDLNGVVITKKINLGDHVMGGSPLFEIADFSKVWLMFDVYEMDIPWIKKGADISLTIQSYPGEEFKGKINYIDPVIDPETRVAKARVEMGNKDQKLKPEMFASAIVEAKLNNYPEAVVVPKSAVMWTGKRSVVYVKSKEGNGYNFVLRKVILGPTLGESYIIEEGLVEGEEIAVNGTFSIDAAAQLAGKPSMMNPELSSSSIGAENSISQEAKESLKPIYNAYLSMKDALAQDDFQKARNAGEKLKTNLNKVELNNFDGKSHSIWMNQSKVMKKALEHINHIQNIEEARSAFFQLSNAIVILTDAFKPYPEKLYLQHCPMANSDKGADWLSLNDSIVNPYFGASMLSCGEVQKAF